MKTLIVIPARFASTRFPEKMLKNATGKPLIQHVYEKVKRANADQVIIATDDQRIVAAVENFGGKVLLTKTTHKSGTDRIAEVASKTPGFDIIVNVQGDEPEIEPTAINHLIQIHKNHQPFMSTLCCKFPKHKTSGHGSPLDPACVKVVLGKEASKIAKYAIYFSRSPIPYPKDTQGVIQNPENYYLHVGMYAYSPSSIQQFTTLPPGFLENIEGLEQLRAIEKGFPIIVGTIDHAFPGIDTKEDYEAFVQRWKSVESRQ